MTSETATIQVYRQGKWQSAAWFKPADVAQGYRGPCELAYHIEYAVQFARPKMSQTAGISCRFPVNFDLHQFKAWPAFLLDVLPNGYGRAQWLDHLSLRNNAVADWPLLLHGTGCPPGNLRIAEAVAAKDPDRQVPALNGTLVPMHTHPGFTREEVISRSEVFVEYAFQHGMDAAGAFDVHGEAPKLLLVEDTSGRWHAEGVLPDESIARSWIVKSPRGNGTAADRKILRNEPAYMAVALALGLQVHAPLEWKSDSLFISRFDRSRLSNGRLRRLGMESLYSLAGIADYGAWVSHDILVEALLQYSTAPSLDLLEYMKRDILNVVFGNKDNHGRNTAVLKDETGRVRLSPFFDFAPMYLEPEGISRVCRWEGTAESNGVPDWSALVSRYASHLVKALPDLRAFGQKLEALPDIAHTVGVDDDIIEFHMRSIDDHAAQLKAL